ncbi:hypothetical protein L7F22_029800 [Adiantum nelumboides]|nr:hypothetical protein [Adiantum nelumboides]
MEAFLSQATISPYCGGRPSLSSKLLSRSRIDFARHAPSVRKTAGSQIVVLAGKPAAVPLEEQLSNSEDLVKWQAARQPLLGFSVSEQDANQVLAKSFGWCPSPYWGEERAKTMPDPALVQKTLDFLRGLGLSEADVPAFLKKFPEVLGCLVEEEMQKNVQILEKEWGISGSTLRNLLLRNPKVLGYNVDCKGDCMAQCTRCWVRF